MACVALKALTKAAGVAIVKAQKEAFDAVHKLLEDFDVDSAVIEALEELTAKFTAGKSKRAKTGYNLFIAEHMKESKAIRQRAGESELKSVDHMKLACAAWKELADDEQEKYREMARGLVANGATSDTDTVTSVPEEIPEETEVEVPVKKAKVTKAKAKAKKATPVEQQEEEETETVEETVQKPVRKAKGKGKGKKAVDNE